MGEPKAPIKQTLKRGNLLPSHSSSGLPTNLSLSAQRNGSVSSKLSGGRRLEPGKGGKKEEGWLKPLPRFPISSKSLGERQTEEQTGTRRAEEKCLLLETRSTEIVTHP